jgi:hypothetical protein
VRSAANHFLACGSQRKETTMKLFRILTAIVLVLTSSTSASAVVVMRTSPFPGYYVSTGSAHCAVINGGTTAGNATIALYDAGGTLLTSGTFSVPVNATRVGDTRSLTSFSPTMCECTVPTTTTFRCSFIYLNSIVNPSNILVIEAK